NHVEECNSPVRGSPTRKYIGLEVFGRCPSRRAGVEAAVGEHRDRVATELGVDVAFVERDASPRAGADVFEITRGDPRVRPRHALRSDPDDVGRTGRGEEAPHEEPERK